MGVDRILALPNRLDHSVLHGLESLGVFEHVLEVIPRHDTHPVLVRDDEITGAD